MPWFPGGCAAGEWAQTYMLFYKNLDGCAGSGSPGRQETVHLPVMFPQLVLDGPGKEVVMPRHIFVQHQVIMFIADLFNVAVQLLVEHPYSKMMPERDVAAGLQLIADGMVQRRQL